MAWNKTLIEPGRSFIRSARDGVLRGTKHLVRLKLGFFEETSYTNATHYNVAAASIGDPMVR